MFLRRFFQTLSIANHVVGKQVARTRPNRLFKSFSSDAATPDKTLQNVELRKINPRRAILYVPGHDERKIDKSMAIDVDSVVLDCEDGVAINKKEEARHLIQKKLQTLTKPRGEIAVRINSVESGFAEEDLNVLFSGEKVPHTIFLPKVEKKEDLDWFAEKLVKSLNKRKINDINLITYVESAKGLLDLRDICNHAIELSEFNLFDLDGIVFGSDDFCANIGATRSNEASEVLYARQQVVVIAKAFNLQAIDVVFIDYKDLEGLKKQAIEGAKLGFTGKQTIHPDQVPIVQQAFTPSQDRVEWATELIKQFGEHQKAGTGAFVFRGQMIDKPLLLQAQKIIDIVKALDFSTEKNNFIPKTEPVNNKPS